MFVVLAGVAWEGYSLKGVYASLTDATVAADKAFADKDAMYDWASVYAANVGADFDLWKATKVYNKERN